MLLNDFYKVLALNEGSNPNEFSAQVELNASHPIYKGHFPEMPVSPGVCLTQVIQDLLAQHVKHDLFMMSADNIKFLIPINPQLASSFLIRFSYSGSGSEFACSASFEESGKTYLKFKGKFQLAEGL